MKLGALDDIPTAADAECRKHNLVANFYRPADAMVVYIAVREQGHFDKTVQVSITATEIVRDGGRIDMLVEDKIKDALARLRLVTP